MYGFVRIYGFYAICGMLFFLKNLHLFIFFSNFAMFFSQST